MNFRAHWTILWRNADVACKLGQSVCSANGGQTDPDRLQPGKFELRYYEDKDDNRRNDQQQRVKGLTPSNLSTTLAHNLEGAHILDERESDSESALFHSLILRLNVRRHRGLNPFHGIYKRFHRNWKVLLHGIARSFINQKL